MCHQRSAKPIMPLGIAAWLARAIWFHWSLLCTGSEKLGILFEQWAECSGNWQKSSLYLQMRESRTNRKHGCRRWMTRKQVIEKWGQKIGDEICDLKLSDPESSRTQVKNHPDHPTSEAGASRFS